MSVPSKRVPPRPVPENSRALVDGRFFLSNTITVGAEPSLVAVSPDGRHGYVTNLDDGTVSVFDTSTLKVTATISVGPAPHGVAVSPDGAFVYVACKGDPGGVIAIDLATEVTKRIPTTSTSGTLVAVAPNGATVYTYGAWGEIVVINAASLTEEGVVDIIEGFPGGMALSADGTTLYVTDDYEALKVVDLASRSVTATIELPYYAHGVALAPDGRRLYVTSHDADSVAVVDTASARVVATIAVGKDPYQLASSPDGLHVLVPNSGEDTVSVIDTKANSVAYTIAVPGGPDGVAFTPDGARVFVANSGTRSVSVLERAATPAFASADATTGTAGEPFTFPIAVTGTPAPTLTTPTKPVQRTAPGKNSLPSGLAMNTDTVPYGVTGTIDPAVIPGTYSFGLLADNGVGPGVTQTLTITVDPVLVGPTFDSADVTAGIAGQPLTAFPIMVRGNPAPTLSTPKTPTHETTPGMDRLPKGLVLDMTKAPFGVTGTVDASAQKGEYSFGLLASNGVGMDAHQSFRVLVVVPAPEAPTFTSAEATTGTAGQPFRAFPITVTGKPAPVLTTPTKPSEETTPGKDRLPKGLVLNISTTPFGVTGTIDASVLAGAYSFGLSAANGAAPDATQTVTITVAGFAPTFTSARTVAGMAGQPFTTFPVTVTGNPAPVLTAPAAPDHKTTPGTNRLPKGLVLHPAKGSFEITGTIDPAVQQGWYTFELQAANGISPDAHQQMVVVVVAPAAVAPAFISQDRKTGTVGEAFTLPIVMTGNPVPTLSTPNATFEAITPGEDRLPKGLTVTAGADPLRDAGSDDQ